MKDLGRPGRTRRAQPHRYKHINAPKQRVTLSGGGGGGNEGVPPKPRPPPCATSFSYCRFVSLFRIRVAPPVDTGTPVSTRIFACPDLLPYTLSLTYFLTDKIR